MSAPIRLTVVPDEGQAEILCGLLRSEGIRCAHMVGDVSAEALLTYAGWHEVFVDEGDLSGPRSPCCGGAGAGAR